MRGIAREILWCVTIYLAIRCPSIGLAQVTSVELLGTITANQVSSGLGFVVPQEASDWEFAAASAAGATHVRFQCSWNNVENQSAPPRNISLGFVQDPNCVSGFNSALSRRLAVTV